MLKNHNILFLCSSYWNGLWTRKHRFMKMLSAYNKIIFVEREPSILTPLTTPGFSGVIPNLFPRERRIDNNLIIYSPPCLFPGAHSKYQWSNYINQRIMINLLRRLINKYFHKKEFILWTSLHSIPLIYENIEAKIKIFDCTDEISLFNHVNKKFVVEWEKRLIELCDIVFVTNETLFKNKSKFNNNTFYIPNGTDFNIMNSVQTTQFNCPSDLREINHPRILFLGTVSTWTDIELIYEAAKKFKAYNFIVVGLIKRGILINKSSFKNIYYLGRKKYESIPSYIQNVDVCISTFKMNELSKSISPLKVYDYMATGKPVIASYMPELEKYQDCLMLYKTKEKFFNFLTNYMYVDNLDKAKKRIEIVKNNHSWGTLLEKICKIITDYEKSQ